MQVESRSYIATIWKLICNVGRPLSSSRSGIKAKLLLHNFDPGLRLRRLQQKKILHFEMELSSDDPSAVEKDFRSSGDNEKSFLIKNSRTKKKLSN